MTGVGEYSASRLRDYASAWRATGCGCGACSQCAARDLTPNEADEIAECIDTLRRELHRLHVEPPTGAEDHTSIESALKTMGRYAEIFRPNDGFDGEDMRLALAAVSRLVSWSKQVVPLLAAARTWMPTRKCAAHIREIDSLLAKATSP